jgi:hypothetical protein
MMLLHFTDSDKLWIIDLHDEKNPPYSRSREIKIIPNH